VRKDLIVLSRDPFMPYLSNLKMSFGIYTQSNAFAKST